MKHAAEEAARQLAACMLRVSLTPHELVITILASLVVGIMIGGLAASIFWNLRLRRATRG